jgi:hypothetical protein
MLSFGREAKTEIPVGSSCIVKTQQENLHAIAPRNFDWYRRCGRFCPGSIRNSGLGYSRAAIHAGEF